MTTFVSDREIYEQMVRDRVPLARQRLWIATADIKDMYVWSHDGFSIATGGFHFVYNEYEVASYAAGAVEVVVNY